MEKSNIRSALAPPKTYFISKFHRMLKKEKKINIGASLTKLEQRRKSVAAKAKPISISTKAPPLPAKAANQQKHTLAEKIAATPATSV